MDVGEVHADRGLTDAHFAGTRRAVGGGVQLENFRTAESMDYDLARHRAPPVKSGIASSTWIVAESASAAE